MRGTHWEVKNGLWVFLAATEDVDPGEWDTLYAQMSPERQAKCDRLRLSRDKALCILAGALARRALSALSGRPPEALTFQISPKGKPFAVGSGLEFSLSHSGSLALCAAAPFPVGTDLQRQRPVSDSLLRRAKRAGFSGTSEADFFSWWVRQEAAGKCTGQGLSLAPLPDGLAFLDGSLAHGEETYYYSICANRAFLLDDPVI